MAAIGARRCGIVPHRLALEAGATRAGLRWLRKVGVLIRVGPGVDRLRDHPFDWRSRCQAALDLAGPGAVLGLRTAARLHGCYRYRHVDVVEVLVPRGRHHRNPVARLVETRMLPAAHVEIVDGFPVTTMARTFFDLCGDPDGTLRVSHRAHEQHMISVYNDALARRGLTFVQEAAVLLVMARRGRAGTKLVRTILTRFGRAYTPTGSDTETLFAGLVDAHGLPKPERQVPISDAEGFIGTVDFLWRAARLIVEIDSTWHDGPLDMARDAARDARLRAAGYVVRRWRYADIVERPDEIAAELAALLAVSTTETAASWG